MIRVAEPQREPQRATGRPGTGPRDERTNDDEDRTERRPDPRRPDLTRELRRAALLHRRALLAQVPGAARFNPATVDSLLPRVHVTPE